MQIFVDQTPKMNNVFSGREGRILAKDLKAELGNMDIRDVLFLICGPDECDLDCYPFFSLSNCISEWSLL